MTPTETVPYTFEQFQATRRAEADISAVLKYDDEGQTSGYAYCGCLYIEDVDSWDDCAPGKGKGRWYLLLGLAEFLSDDLELLERRLYQHAINERFPLQPE